MDDDFQNDELRSNKSFNSGLKKQSDINNSSHMLEQTPEQIRSQMYNSDRNVVDNSKPFNEKNTILSPLVSSNPSDSKEKSGYIEGEGLIYKVCGEGSQYIELVLRPGCSMVGDEQNMLYYDKGIEIDLKVNAENSTAKGLISKVMDVGMSTLTGRRIFLKNFKNKSSSPRKLAFSPPINGKIVVLNVTKLGGSFLCRKSAFLCAGENIYLNSASRSEKGAGVLNNGVEMEKISGKGLVALFFSGSLVQKKLAEGQILNVNDGVTVARQGSVDLKVNKKVDNSSAGEYKITEILTGPGYVWLQSVPQNRLTKDLTKRTNKILSKFNIKKQS